MSVADFEFRLADPAPGIWCYACGDATENPVFLARVRNRLNPPASAQALVRIDQLFGPGSSVRDFYAKYDGAVMYEDTLLSLWTCRPEYAAGVRFFPVEEWDDRSHKMRENLVAMGWVIEDFPTWLANGIVFCEIPASGNFFVIDPGGENKGKVYYADHDRFEEDAIADSFDRFLNGVAFDPAAFMNWCGCYTRYSDGKTEMQWIPKQYVSQAPS